MMKKLFTIVLTLVLTLTAAGCGAKESNGDEAGRSGTIAMLGSTSMEKVMKTLAEQFEQDHTGASVSVEGGGSGAGIEAARTGTADVGLASRELLEEELDQGLTGTVLALDGIAVIVNVDNPVTDLTVEQIAGIFTGEIGRWSQVGGNDLEIARVGREAGSGTRDGFETITGTEDRCVLSQELTSSGGVVEAVRGNPQAIGYASLSAAEGQEGVRLLTVGGVACSEAAVLDGSYAIQRPFVLVTRESGELSAQARAFFDWATSGEAADLIRSAGAVPTAE